MENGILQIIGSTAIAAILGATLVFIVGIANIIVLIRHNNKSEFISLITQERVRYIIELRKNLSEFCALASQQTDLNINDIKKLKYNILLSLCPIHRDWDGKVISLITQIINTEVKDREDFIKELIVLNQFMLQMEWEGVQLESKKGILNEMEKQDLRNRNLVKYKQFKT